MGKKKKISNLLNTQFVLTSVLGKLNGNLVLCRHAMPSNI